MHDLIGRRRISVSGCADCAIRSLVASLPRWWTQKWISYLPNIECHRMMTMEWIQKKKKRKSIDVQSANEGSSRIVFDGARNLFRHTIFVFFFFFAFLLAGLVGVQSVVGHVRNLSSPILKPSQIAPNYFLHFSNLLLFSLAIYSCVSFVFLFFSNSDFRDFRGIRRTKEKKNWYAMPMGSQQLK